MTRHPNDYRTSSPAVQRAREREEARHEHAPSSRVVRDVTQPGGVRVDLDVKVDEIEDGVDIDEALPAGFVSELLDDNKEPHWSARGDAKLRVHLEREASFVRIKGQARFELSHPCVRCLNDVPFDWPLQIDLRLVERAAGPIEADMSEGDGDGDDFEGKPLGDAADLEDLDIASYANGVVKVGDLLREQLFLELPPHPACDSPRAKPTAPCAFDERQVNADASQGWTEARWAGLASLRDKLPPGPAASTKPPAAKAAKPATADDVEVVALPGRATPIELPGRAGTPPAPPKPAPAPKGTRKVEARPPAKKAPTKKAKPTAKKAKPAAKKPVKKPVKKPAKKPAKKAKASKKPGKKAKKAAKKVSKRKPAKKAGKKAKAKTRR
jgi:uncharacterized metal-binding protein YceD (DUF177 family)